jgi:hypothetical protein
MRTARRLALATATVLLLAACTSEPADESDGANGGNADGSGDGAAARTVGVTDDTITISMLSTDLALLVEQNLAPPIGNPDLVAKAVVEHVNREGGVAGRQVELRSHVLDVDAAILNPEAAQADCIEATEEDEPLATVIAAALPSALVRCVSVQHPVVSMTMNHWDDDLYADAEGRVFSCCTNTSAGTNRQYAAWPRLLQEAGALEDDATIGIISSQGGGIATDQKPAIDAALKPALTELGFEIAAEAELPCPETSQTCEQHAAAIQRMKDANVDFVFMTASTLAGQSTVQAAKDLDFHPQWATIGDNVTDTVANFYQPVKDEYDGAWGIDTVFDDPTEEAAECNRIAVAGGAEEFPEGHDGYGFTAVTCLQLQVLFDAIESIDGDITQAALVEALEGMETVPTAHGPEGSFGPGKHDAGDHVFVSRYSATTGVFEPLGGSPEPQALD